MAKLTPKQCRFVNEYLIDLNGTQAAIRAGYSKHRADQIGYENLRKPEIQAAIQLAQRARCARTGITADRVLAEIARVAFADPRSVMSWGPGGVELKESSTLTDDEAAIVAEVSETVTTAGGTVKLKLVDKIAALEKLARHIGIYDRAEDDNKKIIIERSYASEQ